MKKISIIGEPRSYPVYDEMSGKLKGWRFAYNINKDTTELRYFMNSLLASGYKKMCRFQTRFLRQQNENTK